jgi:LPS export ABC transporter permease LptG/LPS export ABC transporter permease LptF
VLKFFDRYLIKEIVPPFFIGLLLATFVLLMNQILILAELFITKGVTFRAALKIFVYIIPAILAFALPMAVLMGILAGLSRLSSDSEILAFKTLGIDYKRLLIPVLLFSIGGWLLTSFLTLYLAPRSNYKWVQTIAESVLTKVQFKIHPREFNESIPGTVLFIQDIIHEKEWKNIFIHFSNPPEEPRIILAKGGKLNFYPDLKRATIELYDGTLHSYPLVNPEKYSVTSFKELEEEIDVETLFYSFSKKKRVREKDIQELFKGVKNIRRDLTKLEEEKARQKDFDAEDPKFNTISRALRQKKKDYISHWVEIHKKFAFPFVCLIFSFLGLPLGASTRKGGRTSGFTISLGIILVYYVLITAGEQMAMDGKISPFLGMWGGNIILALVASYLFYKSLKESPLFSRIPAFFKKRKKILDSAKKKNLSFGWPRLSLRFPNILDRYIIRKYVAIFILVFLALILISVIVTFFERIDNVYEHNKSISLLFEYIWFNLPEFIHYILPVTALTSALLALGLLTKFNEITAMKACGISLYRIIIPIILMAVLISLFSFYVQEDILPYSNKKREEVWNKINDVPPRSYIYLDRRWVLSREKDRIYHYNYFDPDEAVFNHLSIFDLSLSSWSFEKRIYSERGYLRDGNLALENCWVRDFLGEKTERYERRSEMDLSQVEEMSYFLKEWKEPNQMNFGELSKYIKEIEESGFDTVKFKVDLHYKVSFPLASLIMTILGIPFAFSMGRRGTLVGIGLSIVIAMIYWGAIGVFRELGVINFLPAFLSAWGPNLVFGLVGLYFLFTLKT